MEQAVKSHVIYNAAPLKALTKDMTDNRSARARVGILGSSGKVNRFDINSSTQTKDDLNNPSLGLIHEFGSATQNIPARSFLRVPLVTELPNKMRLIGAKVWSALVEKQGIRFALEQLGLAGVQVVEMAFRTGGYGQWAPLKAFTIRRKGSAAILIDSGQLRRSVSSAVVGGARP